MDLDPDPNLDPNLDPSTPAIEADSQVPLVLLDTVLDDPSAINNMASIDNLIVNPFLTSKDELLFNPFAAHTGLQFCSNPSALINFDLGDNMQNFMAPSFDDSGQQVVFIPNTNQGFDEDVINNENELDPGEQEQEADSTGEHLETISESLPTDQEQIATTPVSLTTDKEAIEIAPVSLTTEDNPMVTTPVSLTTTSVPLPIASLPLPTGQESLTTVAMPLTTAQMPLTTSQMPLTTTPAPLVTPSIPSTQIPIATTLFPTLILPKPLNLIDNTENIIPIPSTDNIVPIPPIMAIDPSSVQALSASSLQMLNNNTIDVKREFESVGQTDGTDQEIIPIPPIMAVDVNSIQLPNSVSQNMIQMDGNSIQLPNSSQNNVQLDVNQNINESVNKVLTLSDQNSQIGTATTDGPLVSVNNGPLSSVTNSAPLGSSVNSGPLRTFVNSASLIEAYTGSNKVMCGVPIDQQYAGEQPSPSGINLSQMSQMPNYIILDQGYVLLNNHDGSGEVENVSLSSLR